MGIVHHVREDQHKGGGHNSSLFHGTMGASPSVEWFHSLGGNMGRLTNDRREGIIFTQFYLIGAWTWLVKKLERKSNASVQLPS